MQTKFKYPAETTANAARIPRQMSLFIKQDQITSNLKKWLKNNCNTRKVAPSFTQKMTPKQIQEESEQNYHIFQFKLKNARTRNNSQRSQQQTKDPFTFLWR